MAEVESKSRSRITALDILRGIVMLLMAIDHVRVYAGVTADGTTAPLFLTRWITNFCAPTFVFLAGTGIYLLAQKLNDNRALSKYLLTRGLFLVLLELTFLRFAWTFNFDYQHFIMAGVIWMIGWCMVLMTGIIRLPFKAIAATGIVMILVHNVIDLFGKGLRHTAEGSSLSWLWKVLYMGGVVNIGGKDGPPFAVLYVLIPWIGLMCVGYAFGLVMTWEPERRRRFCLRVGLGAIAAFFLLRVIGVYGDPRPWHSPEPWTKFLGAAKYPPSLIFLLMTIGPLIAVLPLAEKARGRFSSILATYGRAPLFFYVLHIPLIHVAAILVSYIRNGAVTPWLFMNFPMFVPPAAQNYVWTLPLLYIVWLIVVAILYWPCRWLADLKVRSSSKWLSYL